MNDKVLRTLEFDKVLQKLETFATGDSVKEKVLGLKPETDLYLVEESLSETDQALKCLLKFASPPHCAVKGQTASIKRAMSGGVLSMKELLDIARVLSCGKAYHGYGEGIEEFPVLAGYIRDILPFDTLEADITSSILNEEEMADNASSELLSIRRTIRQLGNKVRDTLNGFISGGNAKFLQEALITTRNGRFVVPVKAEHKGDVPGLVHDTSSTGATLFIEPMAVVETNNKLKQEEQKEKYEIERILQMFSQRVADCGEDILVNIEALIKLDFAFAKGKYALDYNGVKPKVNDKGVLNIKKARHPLLDPKKAVPIDIRLGDDFDTLVITGPNTGGKTVSLKTFGLLCLMAQSGLLIPAADNAEISVFRKIFADIGDEQSIEQSLSTFSAHMTNIVKIVKFAGRGSLVLFDELGAGTDPTEGAALAMSILEHVRKKGAKTVATTHYSELKLYAMTEDRVQNASCAFDVETLRPTYQLNIGMPGKSNAFAISEKLGLDKKILEQAEDYLSGENVKFEDVLKELEQNRQQTEAEQLRAEELSQKAADQQASVEKTYNRLEKEKIRIEKEAMQKAQKIIEDAEAEVAAMLDEVKALRAAEKQKEAQQELERIRKELREKSGGLSKKIQKKKPQAPGAVPQKLIPGMRVYVVDTDTEGTVLALPDKKGNVTVQTGILKITVPLSSLREAKEDTGAEVAKRYSVNHSTLGKSQVISPELDIRGKFAEEGVAEMERFIDDAVVANLKTVTIVHGKGTGALRQAIHDALKCNRRVEEFRLGRFGEGDLGVTVVQLK
ncbi:MAG: endonuclease MutS2 [Clostridia bacterium]|nr:endonuclease MutS2 [Clostridia bacterium]